MAYEYKTVGAPEKGKRKRGARSKSDKVAAAFEEVLGAEAVDGWEYMRTDLVPVVERSGFFARVHEVHRAVMVFRRSLDRAEAPHHVPLFDPEMRRAPAVVPQAAPPTATPSSPLVAQRQDPVARVPGPAAAGEEDQPDLMLAQQLRAPTGPSGRR